MLISDIINAKTNIALTVTEYDTYPVIKITGQPYTVVQFIDQQLKYTIDDKCLNTILDLMNDLKKLGYEVCLCKTNTAYTITTIIIKKPTDWNTVINVTPIYMYTKNNIELENVDDEYTENILLNQTSETDVIIDFHDDNKIPVKVRLKTMLDEPSYGIVVTTDNTGYKEIKLFELQNINFNNIQRLKDYSNIIWLMTLIVKHM